MIVSVWAIHCNCPIGSVRTDGTRTKHSWTRRFDALTNESCFVLGLRQIRTEYRQGTLARAASETNLCGVVRRPNAHRLDISVSSGRDVGDRDSAIDNGVVISLYDVVDDDSVVVDSIYIASRNAVVRGDAIVKVIHRHKREVRGIQSERKRRSY